MSNKECWRPLLVTAWARHQTPRLALLLGIAIALTAVPGRFDSRAAERRGAAQANDADGPRGFRTHTAEASPGYVVFNPNRSVTTYVVDPEGRVVHTWESDYGPGGGAYVRDNGHLLRGVREPDVPVFSGGGQSGRLREITWDGDVVWDFRYASEDRLLHHDVAVMSNGNLLAVAWEAKSRQEARDAGRLPALTPDSGLWPDNMVLEFAPRPPDSAQIVWEWHMWDHTIQNADPNAHNYGDPADHPELIDINGDREAPELSAEELERVLVLSYVPDEMSPDDLSADFLHTNAVNYNATLDQIVLSVPRFNEIWVIDHSTTTTEAAGHRGGRWGRGGDLLYRWGTQVPTVGGRRPLSNWVFNTMSGGCPRICLAEGISRSSTIASKILRATIRRCSN